MINGCKRCTFVQIVVGLFLLSTLFIRCQSSNIKQSSSPKDESPEEKNLSDHHHNDENSSEYDVPARYYRYVQSKRNIIPKLMAIDSIPVYYKYDSVTLHEFVQIREYDYNTITVSLKYPVFKGNSPQVKKLNKLVRCLLETDTYEEVFQNIQNNSSLTCKPPKLFAKSLYEDFVENVRLDLSDNNEWYYDHFVGCYNYLLEISTFLISKYYSLGGAHPMFYIHYFNLMNERVLHYKDIFTDTLAFKKILTKFLRRKYEIPDEDTSIVVPIGFDVDKNNTLPLHNNCMHFITYMKLLLLLMDLKKSLCPSTNFYPLCNHPFNHYSIKTNNHV